jgi:hypothetical protein
MATFAERSMPLTTSSPVLLCPNERDVGGASELFIIATLPHNAMREVGFGVAPPIVAMGKSETDRHFFLEKRLTRE